MQWVLHAPLLVQWTQGALAQCDRQRALRERCMSFSLISMPSKRGGVWVLQAHLSSKPWEPSSKRLPEAPQLSFAAG